MSPEIEREIDVWETEMQRFLSGDLAPERWRSFRLAHGVYGQRQDGVQMIRVKIPGGALDGARVLRLAEIAAAFANGIAHLTTRQDVQFHFVQLERVPALLRSLAEAGLTTREACGNSVRNVTACPVSGFIAEEAFDVQPYAAATYAFLVRNAFCQQMARKFKIAFSACPEDCAATAIHDIGALGRVVTTGGRTRYGFRIVVGGGLGPTPFLAQVLEDFVPLAELLPTIKAVLRVYSDLGNRTNKGRARLKFVVARLGIEEFRRRVLEEHAALTEEERDEAELLHNVPEESRALVAGHLAGSPDLEEIEGRADLAAHRPAVWADAWAEAGEREGFLRWQSTSVRPHRDPERVVVTILVPLGDLEAGQLRTLADLVRTHGADQLRVGREQNLVLPSVARSSLGDVYHALLAAGLAQAGAGTALDVTSCPGADTCRLGITSSKGLARAIREELAPLAANGGLPLLRDASIKISGCPNSCGQHHVATIGFHGVVRSIDGKQAPAYQLHLGGRADGANGRIGTALFKIPARSVPKAVAALVELYRSEREEGESLAEFAARVPRDRAELVLRPFVSEPPPRELRHLDWGATQTYSTDDLGTGECAGAGEEATADPFDPFRTDLLQAALFLERGQRADALAHLNRSQYTLARILLAALGKKPESDYEVACELRAHVIDRGLAGEGWNDVHERIVRALRTKHPHPIAIHAILKRSRELLPEAMRTFMALTRRRHDSSGAAADIPA